MPYSIENIFNIGIFGILLHNATDNALKVIAFAAGMLLCMAAGYFIMFTMYAAIIFLYYFQGSQANSNDIFNSGGNYISYNSL